MLSRSVISVATLRLLATGAVSLAQVGALVGAVNDTASNKIVNKRIMNWRACPCRRPVNEAAA
jgi:hypothetical protein